MNNNNGIITSSPSQHSVTWEVQNSNDYPVRVQWINFNGISKEEGFVVGPGESLKPGTTYISHVFIVTHAETAAFVTLINVMSELTVIPTIEMPSTEVEAIEERQAISIEGTTYHLKARVLTKEGKPAGNLTVAVFDQDRYGTDDALGTVQTAADGGFDLTFDLSQFTETTYDRKPDLYFRFSDESGEIHSTRESTLWNVTEATLPITLTLP